LSTGFECLESTAFNGIGTNLVVYLETVLHGSSVASASNVTTWIGTSYLTPVFGVIFADTFWGNYNTILVSLLVYLFVSTLPLGSDPLICHYDDQECVSF
jgi:solute carrier family 15 (peptide/histidine transporter), member 3/4